MPPESWAASRQGNSLYPGKFCRVRRALQTLYDACVHLRGGSGASWWHDHLGHFWRGMNTSTCVRAPKSGAAKRWLACNDDSRVFSAYDRQWLDVARPLIARDLLRAPHGEALASQARSGAASMDRLLLLLARLACLTSDARRSSGSGEWRAPLSSLDVLVAGGGPVGLLSAVQARLTGANVGVWEKRGLLPRTRDNVVDASESDRSSPEHPAALSLMENVGLLHLGLGGMWVRPRFLRASAEQVAPCCLLRVACCVLLLAARFLRASAEQVAL